MKRKHSARLNCSIMKRNVERAINLIDKKFKDEYVLTTIYEDKELINLLFEIHTMYFSNIRHRIDHKTPYDVCGSLLLNCYNHDFTKRLEEDRNNVKLYVKTIRSEIRDIDKIYNAKSV